MTVALALLIPALIVVGLVIWLVRRARPGGGTSAAEIIAYLILLVATLVAVNAVSSLLSLAFPQEGVVGGGSTLALAVASLVVAGPIAIGMWIALQRREEPQSAGRDFYLAMAVVITLAVSAGAAMSLLQAAFGVVEFRTDSVADLVAFGAAFLLHEWLRARSTRAGTIDDIRLLGGSTIGLFIALAGAGAIVGTGLDALYDLVGDSPIIGGDPTSTILAGVAALIVGLPIWWWYWLRGLRRRNSGLAEGYSAVVAVLSLVAVLSAAGGVLGIAIDWVLSGLPSDAAARFNALPGLLTVIGLGLVVWWHHLRSMQDDRLGVRPYQYAMSVIGLGAMAGAVAALLVFVFQALSGEQVIGGDDTARGLVAGGLAALFVSGLVVVRFWWGGARLMRATDGSGVRRFAVTGTLILAAITTAASLISVIYVLVQSALDSAGGENLWSAEAVPASLTIAFGLLTAHLANVQRADRKSAPQQARPASQVVTVVAANPGPLPGLLPGMRYLARSDGQGVVEEARAHEIVAAVQATEARHVLVVVDDESHRVVPLT